MKTWIIGAILATGVMVWGAAAFQKADQPASQSTACSSTLDEPEAGANVGSDGDASGHATLPKGTFCWILARKKSIQGYWPQANGPVQIEADGGFKAFVTYGKDGDKGPFEIAVAIVDERVNQTLQRWVDRANETGRYPAIAFPNVHAGCPVTRAIVTRQ